VSSCGPRKIELLAVTELLEDQISLSIEDAVNSVIYITLEGTEALFKGRDDINLAAFGSR